MANESNARELNQLIAQAQTTAIGRCASTGKPNQTATIMLDGIGTVQAICVTEIVPGEVVADKVGDRWYVRSPNAPNPGASRQLVYRRRRNQETSTKKAKYAACTVAQRIERYTAYGFDLQRLIGHEIFYKESNKPPTRVFAAYERSLDEFPYGSTYPNGFSANVQIIDSQTSIVDITGFEVFNFPTDDPFGLEGLGSSLYSIGSLHIVKNNIPSRIYSYRVLSSYRFDPEEVESFPDFDYTQVQYGKYFPMQFHANRGLAVPDVPPAYLGQVFRVFPFYPEPPYIDPPPGFYWRQANPVGESMNGNRTNFSVYVDPATGKRYPFGLGTVYRRSSVIRDVSNYIYVPPSGGDPGYEGFGATAYSTMAFDVPIPYDTEFNVEIWEAEMLVRNTADETDSIIDNWQQYIPCQKVADVKIDISPDSFVPASNTLFPLSASTQFKVFYG